MDFLAGHGFERERCWENIWEREENCVFARAEERVHVFQPAACAFESVVYARSWAISRVGYQLSRQVCVFRSESNCGSRASVPMRGSDLCTFVTSSQIRLKFGLLCFHAVRGQGLGWARCARYTRDTWPDLDARVVERIGMDPTVVPGLELAQLRRDLEAWCCSDRAGEGSAGVLIGSGCASSS